MCFNFQCSWQSFTAGPAPSPCVSLVWLLSHWSADHYGKQLPQPTIRYISNDLFTDLHSSLVALSLLLCFELLIIFDFNYRGQDSLTQLYQHLSFLFNYLAPVLSSGDYHSKQFLWFTLSGMILQTFILICTLYVWLVMSFNLIYRAHDNLLQVPFVDYKCF